MSPDNCINVAICGLGTVGGGTLSILERNSDLIRNRVGCSIRVSHVATRTPKPELVPAGCKSSIDPFQVVADPDIQIVVETIGGTDPAKALIEQSLAAGKHVVTANKALIAEHGNALFKLARQNNVSLAFESAVAGGIPIIKALREGLAGNDIECITGIINGTGNFILTEMEKGNRPFADVLLEAQELGYAEADPTFDVEGIDAAHKLTIMASIAFGKTLEFDRTFTEGISEVTPQDIVFAADLGFRIKHLGISRRTSGGIEVRVHPALVNRTQLLAQVDGVGNAILVQADAVGEALFTGPGAGADATGSAVVADIIDIARAFNAQAMSPVVPALGYGELASHAPVVDIADVESAFYLRITVNDKVGVMAAISSVLEGHGISIESIIQKDVEQGEVPIVLLTHRVREQEMNAAIAQLQRLDEVTGPIGRIRVAPLQREED